MKISVSWIFDHIDSDWKQYDIADLVAKFNKTTAEIEGFYKVDIDLKQFSLAEVIEVDKEQATVSSSEWKQQFQLPFRCDLQMGDVCLIKKTGDGVSWAKLTDMHCEKEGFVPVLLVSQKLIAGEWKKQLDFQDYILEVDNKSITHRPDMWGHRGFAREFASMLDLPFLPLQDFISEKTISQHDDSWKNTPDFPIDLSLKDQVVGKRFACHYLYDVENKPSTVRMAYRLMITGNRPINFLVDATNYVMLDLSQPMHAFDVQGLEVVEARLAKKGEKLTLLDDQELELTREDYIISDGKKPISLAGIMGGKTSGISEKTKTILLEAAHFDATTIRKTSARFKVRTEASARFEKTLDPNQNVDAILRFMFLLDKERVAYKAANQIVSLGKSSMPIVIDVKHDLICKRLGVVVTPEFVKQTLEKLEFEVKNVGDEIIEGYVVTVPTFRCSKDVTIEEDIIEELGRFFGYDNIPHELPCQKRAPFSLKTVHRVRVIKNILSRALRMRELYSYAFYDEAFLKTIAYEPKDTVPIKNPVSTNLSRLVTSLLPHLFKGVENNVADHDRIRFFESGRTWFLKNNTVVEQKSVAGVFFEKQNQVDFYEYKALMEQLFEVLDLNVTWDKPTQEMIAPWFSAHQTAELLIGKQRIGYAGVIDRALFSKITEGHAFGFELDLDQLLADESEVKRYKSASKYPSVHRDISMFLSLSVTVDTVIDGIQSVDKKVRNVALVDLFEKEEWKDKKSMTIRFEIQDETKTLTTEEADKVFSAVEELVEKLGATVR